MYSWYQFIFPIGLLLLAHSVYLALSVREQLQQHHHSGGEDAAAGSGSYFPIAAHAAGSAAHINASTIPIFVELLAGVVVAIVGHVKRASFNRARLIDKNCFERYDGIMYTGVGFMHFNHRGAAAGGHSGRIANGDTSSLASKKNA
ncbi:hypothetical protein DQ04_01781100 [Trypanosoma grayi]|uniref:hypothetical protein n=1 Tax=Trypanosoma grayi TaxID=71804 RepID=UPI0004F40790|nr:hypothetical protein DQ04_01781100 [Trypanosoma grayi]KEG12346.1 hypothetical protein DQ04_01781100 [Trypanosoma grayi]